MTALLAAASITRTIEHRIKQLFTGRSDKFVKRNFRNEQIPVCTIKSINIHNAMASLQELMALIQIWAGHVNIVDEVRGTRSLAPFLAPFLAPSRPYLLACRP